jgi:hypothetical protein
MPGKKDKSGLPPPSSSSEADVDPISIALRPPADEPPAERAARLRDEAEAKKRSDLIDAQILADREEREKAKKRGDIKILLLGESNSSATLPGRFFPHSSFHPHARLLYLSLPLLHCTDALDVLHLIARICNLPPL